MVKSLLIMALTIAFIVPAFTSTFAASKSENNIPATIAACADRDHDSVCDPVDNCLLVFNPTQSDSDNDGIGDACDYSEPGQGDVWISFNGGKDQLVIGTDNIMEIWIANGLPLSSIQMGMKFTSASGPFTWVTPYGNRPITGNYYIQEHSDAVGKFDLGGFKLNTEKMPDSILFGGASLALDLPSHATHTLCYSLKIHIPAGQTPSTGGFCVDNVFFPPAGSWLFQESGPAFAPNFQGNANPSMANPDAPSVCFDIVNPLAGDANGDGVVNISDPLFLCTYIFRGGAAPYPIAVGDCNCDGTINISDVVYLINYIFSGGPAPCLL